MRPPLPFIALFALLLLASSTRSAREDRHAAIRATPVLLDRDDPARRRVGALAWRGGWRLTSRNLDFGGLSSLVALPGGRFAAIGDIGTIVRFRFADGRVTAADIAAQPGVDLDRQHKRERDTESLAHDPASGRWWIGMEQANRIRRIAPDFARIEASARPSAMRRWPGDTGAETMLRLRDGRFLLLSEGAGMPRSAGPGARAGLLFPGDPTVPGSVPIRFGYRPPRFFLATDATELPDGRVAVVNRMASRRYGVAAAITLFDPRDIRPGRTVPSREIARLGLPLIVDNMEGIAATREGGETILWLLSDDNFMIFEQTLLLKFALVG